MLKKTRIDQFTEECKSLTSQMSLNYRNVSPSFEFSNTGRRGTKYFTITLVELLATLKDIKANLSLYEAAKDYVEGTMRDLFSQTITTETINALSTVQTLPLFSLLNKVIYSANDLDSTFDEKRLNKDIQEQITTVFNNLGDFISLAPFRDGNCCSFGVNFLSTNDSDL